jgi:hypothetical protein
VHEKGRKRSRKEVGKRKRTTNWSLMDYHYHEYQLLPFEGRGRRCEQWKEKRRENMRKKWEEERYIKSKQKGHVMGERKATCVCRE